MKMFSSGLASKLKVYGKNMNLSSFFDIAASISVKNEVYDR